MKWSDGERKKLILRNKNFHKKKKLKIIIIIINGCLLKFFK